MSTSTLLLLYVTVSVLLLSHDGVYGFTAPPSLSSSSSPPSTPFQSVTCNYALDITEYNVNGLVFGVVTFDAVTFVVTNETATSGFAQSTPSNPTFSNFNVTVSTSVVVGTPPVTSASYTHSSGLSYYMYYNYTTASYFGYQSNPRGAVNAASFSLSCTGVLPSPPNTAPVPMTIFNISSPSGIVCDANNHLYITT